MLLEFGTITRQQAHHRELIDPEIERNRDKLIKTPGDGLLEVLPSAADAVRAAIDIQLGMIWRERETNEEEHIRYRVGINVRDVVFDEQGRIDEAFAVLISEYQSVADGGCPADQATAHRLLAELTGYRHFRQIAVVPRLM